MNKDEKVKRMIEVKETIKQLKKEEAELKVILEEILDDTQEMFWYSISKSPSSKYEIKEWVELIDIANKYPEYIKIDASNMYKEVKWASEIINKIETPSITFRKLKVKSLDDQF